MVSAVAAPENVPSVDAQANEAIQRSPAQSEDLLNSSSNRQAVQETLSLPETTSMAFERSQHGNNTVQGKYFSHIIREPMKCNTGRMLAQASNRMPTLHGHLSSDSGVRHGTVPNDAYALSEGDAKLAGDFTGSYISVS
ncbi:hypothetical protein QZM79_04080 [Burkholderia multivorans]|nr:hypothetical protein [Burkholderia multivorans]